MVNIFITLIFAILALSFRRLDSAQSGPLNLKEILFLAYKGLGLVGHVFYVNYSTSVLSVNITYFIDSKKIH